MSETPTQLLTFLRDWCHPNIFGPNWTWDVANYFNDNPGRAAVIRKQLDEAIATPTITIAQTTELIDCPFPDQDRLQSFLKDIRRMIQESDELDLD